MSEEHTDVVEIDAIAGEEWDREQHTPVQIESNLAELVKKSGLDDGWDGAAKDEPAVDKPRTTTNTMRRTGSAPAMPSKVHKTMAMPTLAAVKPAAPAAAPQPKAKLEQKKPATKPATKTTATGVAPVKVAPTFTPFGNEPAAVAKAPVAKTAAGTDPNLFTVAKPTATPTAKSAPVATRAPATPPATPTKIDTAKAAPVAAAKTTDAKVAPALSTKSAAMPAAEPKPVTADAAPAKPARVATPAVSAAKPVRADATPAKPAQAPAATVSATKPARADATPAPAVSATKPARADATPAPAVSATKPARADATPAKPAQVASSAPAVAKPSSTGDVVAAKLASAPVDTAARAPSALELPAWPPVAPSAAPRAITSEATPRLEVASLAAAAQQPFEDWDELGGATSVGDRERSQPARKPGEDSVIVDLNAVSKGEHHPSRRPQTYPILTSEQGTTTSGVFEMPTVEQPMVAQQAMAAQTAAPQTYPRAERPTSPAMPAAASATAAVSASNSAGSSSSAWHTPLPLAAPPPEPAPQWPSAAGLEYNGAHGSEPEIPLPVPRHEPTEPHLARRTLLATVFPTPTSRKRGLLAAAGALAVVLVIVLVSAGGSAKSADANKASASSSPASASSSTTPQAASRATTPTKPAMAAAATTVAVADTAATASTPTSTEPAKKKPVVAKRRISRGKKPVVVDYDKKPDPTPEQDEALTRARADYANGNRHLFAGETDAAIASYRQALAAYPNYVAGYRGLGLAFAQQGNKASALDAFKTYVKLAPSAKDVALIKKRIASLSLR